MAKKNKQRNGPQASTGSTPTAGPTATLAATVGPLSPEGRTAQEVVEQLVALWRKLNGNEPSLSASDLETVEGQLLQLEALAGGLREAQAAAKAAVVEAEQREKAAGLKEREAEEREQKAAAERSRLESERHKAEEVQKGRAEVEKAKQELRDERKKLEDAQQAANAQLAALDAREKEASIQLLERESRTLAELGKRGDEALSSLRQERDALQQALADLHEQKVSLEAAHLQRLLEAKVNAEKELLARADEFQRKTEADLRGAYDSLAQERAAVAEERRELEARRADATTGFASSNAELVRQLETQVDDLRNELTDLRTRISEERLSWERERAEADAAFRMERSALARERRRLELEQDDLEAVRDAEEQMRISSLEVTLGERDARVLALQSQLDILRSELQTFEKIGWQTDNLGPKVLLQRNSDLTKKLEELQGQMAAMLPESERERIRSLEENNEQLEQELSRARSELSQQKARGASRDAVELEVARLRVERDGHERMKKVLQAERDELEKKLDEYSTREKALPPFPECAVIDKKPSHEGSLWQPSSLREFVEEVRSKLAHGVEVNSSGKKQPLHYRPEDLRLLVGGLAMSQLHIFEGPSGTGKTTLPSAFATVIGAGQKLVPVQAGWRDRSDLLGHWNAFQQRFYESRFLQGLYESGSAEWKNRPYFLILDEMNLSRVEQYFADLLSALEAPDEERRVVPVMSEGHASAPLRFKDGKDLPLGRNVWFIGTANHDETTIEFAPKTYDRSFVHELPEVPPRPASLPPPKETGPLDVRHLESLFGIAAATDGADAVRRLGEFGNLFRDDLRRYDIVWAKRLDRQVERFVPTVTACGGSVVEAFDHLLTSRLLRKLRKRHDLRAADLAQLRKDYVEAFESVFEDAPTKGDQLFAEEHERLADLDRRGAA